MKTTQRRLPRRIREQQMIDAAVTAFSRGDYHSVRVEEIAEAAGTSKPTVYHYLGSKEGIFTACVHREGERLIAAIREAVHDPRARSGEDPLRRGMHAFFTFVTGNRESWTVLYRRAAVQGEPFAAEATRMRDRVMDEVAGLITSCTGGLLDEHGAKDAQLLARIAVSTADAYADWLLDHPEESPDAMAGHVTELTWSHLRARRAAPAP
ncbi:TetR/AcrR family transcriptional regulator [Nocardiopsis tropica]|uniref:TetR/AcrR family transcriptional regulator n=1 Tax=Nocardiopsis tropica TaxID=109330 RepID=A0ABU7KSU2_9ACTN|nr:TetR/AcrR family transcriptional regulator [Nocardiopsis umidischolae]MEE2052370.1 TetR/AcrR family transcriptional regulator [Nocardiopsis umidischolae]